MKIAMIGQKGVPASYGGPERHVEELGKRLAGRGHEVHVYVRPYYGSRSDDRRFLKRYEGMHLHTLPSVRTKHLDAITHTGISALHAIPRGMDIVHFHAQGPSTVAWLSRVGFARTVATVHGLDWQRDKWGRLASAYLKFGEFASARFVQGTICVSRSLTRYYEETYGVRPVTIPNGITLPGQVGDELIRKGWGLEPGGYFLYLARLVPEKGCHYLIRAFRGLKTDRRLVITGGGVYTDEYVARLRALAEGDPRIIFTGYQFGDALAELYANAYLYVLPSDLEGLPITLLEAMSHGTPVLVSDIEENREVVEGPGLGKESVGLQFRKGDEGSLVSALGYAEGHAAEIRSMGGRGRHWVEGAYNWERITEETEAFYRSVIG